VCTGKTVPVNFLVLKKEEELRNDNTIGPQEMEGALKHAMKVFLDNTPKLQFELDYRIVGEVNDERKRTIVEFFAIRKDKNGDKKIFFISDRFIIDFTKKGELENAKFISTLLAFVEARSIRIMEKI